MPEEWKFILLFMMNLITLIRETKAEIIDEHSFLDKLQNHTVYFLGDGAEKCKEIILHKNAVFIKNAFPSAKEMAQLSYR